MRQNADLDVNEPIKKFGREKNVKRFKKQRKKNRHAKLGSYVEKTLGSDTTPANFFKKAKSWVKGQEFLRRRIQRKTDREFFSPPPIEMKEWEMSEARNPLAKYAFDDGAFY